MSRMPGFAMPADVTTTVGKSQAKARAMRASLSDGEPRPWYRITNAAADEAELMLYDEVGGWLGAYADEFIAELKGITAPKLTVRVNSPGGSVFEGIAIANALRSHPADVTVQVDGLAASIASVIALAGDRLVMQPNSMLMIHDASGMCLGDAADMQQMAGLLDAISDNIAGAYAAKAGGTAGDWRSLMKAETWYSAEQAVEAGLADEVGKQRGAQPDEPDEPEMRQRFDLAAYGYTPPPATGGVVENPPVVGEDGPPATTLTFNIGSQVDEQLREMIRALTSTKKEQDATEQPAPAADPEPVAEPPTATEGEPEATSPAPAPAQPDDWCALTAHLTQPAPDPWAELTAHLTTTTASPSAAEA